PIFERYTWPGNARELKNAVERMAILSPGDRITAAAVPLEIKLGPDADSRSSLQQTRESAERESILKALEETNWNVSAALVKKVGFNARLIGLLRTGIERSQ